MAAGPDADGGMGEGRHSAERQSRRKQVLVAKCAFSERRNDSYVLAAVITGTLSRAEPTERSELCFCSYSGFHEWSFFPPPFFYRVEREF